MKTPTDDLELTRWLDGEMTPGERAGFTARLDTDAALKRNADSLQQLGQWLRVHLPAELPVPHADFFNSQIQMRIAELEKTEARDSARTTRATGKSWWSLPGFTVAAAAAAAVVVAALAIWTTDDAKVAIRDDSSSVVDTYTPDPGVKPHAFHSNEADATVLMLDGLEELPYDFLLLAGGPH